MRRGEPPRTADRGSALIYVGACSFLLGGLAEAAKNGNVQAVHVVVLIFVFVLWMTEVPE